MIKPDKHNRKKTIKNISYLLISAIFVSCALTNMDSVQSDLKDPEFWTYEENVRKNFYIAFDLYVYDMLAWTSSDSVSARLEENPNLKDELGAEWFIYQDTVSNYHAVYGRYSPDQGTYNTVFHYLLGDDYSVRSANIPIDSLTCLQYARVINQTLPIVDRFMREENLKLNWYVIKDSLGRLNVWYLPSQLSHEYEVYGGDFQYLFDSTGYQLVDSIWNQNEFKIVKPATQKQVTLVNNKNKYPTVDNIFCALNILRKYKHKLSMVYIVSENYLSVLAFSKEKGYSWLHTKREQRNEKFEENSPAD